MLSKFVPLNGESNEHFFFPDLSYSAMGFSSWFFLRHLVLNKMAVDEMDI